MVDVALLVLLHDPFEDGVEYIAVEDGDGEHVADVVEGVDADAEARHADLPCPASGIHGPEGFFVLVVDGWAVTVVLGVAEVFLAVLAHHVPPEVKVWRVRRGQDQNELEYPGRKHAEHPARYRNLRGIPT